MIHSKITSEWVYEHYLLYLFLCIADCDCFISEDEILEIKREAFHYWPAERLTELYKEVHCEFLSHTEDDKTSFISKNAAHFLRTPVVRKKALEHLEKMVPSKDADCEEYVMFRYIRRVINHLK
jgi:hypothetical protein